MIAKTNHSKTPTLPNAFGALGYLFILVQWFWAVMVIGYPYLMARGEQLLVPENTPKPNPVAPIDTGPFLPIILLLSAIIVVIGVVFAIIAMIKLPKTVGQKGAVAAQTAANVIIPVVTHHKVPTKKARKKLTGAIILALKFAAIIVPVTALLFVQPIAEMPKDVVMAVGLLCMAGSLMWFGLQYITAAATKADTTKLW